MREKEEEKGRRKKGKGRRKREVGREEREEWKGKNEKAEEKRKEGKNRCGVIDELVSTYILPVLPLPFLLFWNYLLFPLSFNRSLSLLHSFSLPAFLFFSSSFLLLSCTSFLPSKLFPSLSFAYLRNYWRSITHLRNDVEAQRTFLESYRKSLVRGSVNWIQFIEKNNWVIED